MEKLFEKAPINEEMIPEEISTELFNDFFYVKFLCTKLIGTYLIDPFTDQKRMDGEEKVEDLLTNLNDDDFSYAVESILLFHKKTGPLNLYVKDWLAALLAHWGKKEKSKQIAAIETLPYDIYRVKSYDDKMLMLETRTGDEIMLPRDSFNSLPDATLIQCEHLFTSLAKYQGIWQTNGISSWMNATEAFQAQQEQCRLQNTFPTVNQRILETNNGHPCSISRTTKSFTIGQSSISVLTQSTNTPKNLRTENISQFMFPKKKTSQ